jgi:hypothetical protein
MTTGDAVTRRCHARSVGLLGAALLAVSGCAAIREHEAASTEQLLAAAGFQRRAADDPERLQDLTRMPPFKLVARSKDGNFVYTFADPESCRCLYVGGPKEYSSFQRLRAETEIARDTNEASMTWPLWGPWWW